MNPVSHYAEKKDRKASPVDNLPSTSAIPNGLPSSLDSKPINERIGASPAPDPVDSPAVESLKEATDDEKTNWGDHPAHKEPSRKLTSVARPKQAAKTTRKSHAAGKKKTAKALKGNNPAQSEQPGDSSEKPSKPVKERIRLKKIEEYINACYKFRYNVVTGRLEWTDSDENTFAVLDDYRLNSILRRMENQARMSVSPNRLIGLLKSDFTPEYHPIRAYFGQFDNRSLIGQETPTIEAMAATVTTTGDAALLLLSITRWMVATIANAFQDEGCQNHSCLVLTGEQGAFKTTWLNLFCPPSLLAYLFCGKIDLDKTDTLILLAEKWIVNLDDQLRSLNKRDADTVKTYITQGSIDVRRPYGVFASKMPRLASFCASVNGNDFLTDPTGSRRFLPFEVTAINIEAAQVINMDEAWLEAYRLYKNGYQYWFTKEETAEMFKDSDQFQVQTSEYELFLKYFEPITDPQKANTLLTTTEIKIHLQRATGERLDDKKLGQAIRKTGAYRGKKRKNGQSIYVYTVRERSGDEYIQVDQNDSLPG